MLFNKEWDKKPTPVDNLTATEIMQRIAAMPKAPQLEINLKPGAFNFLSYDEVGYFCPPDIHWPLADRREARFPAPMYVPDGTRVAHCLRFAAAMLESSGWVQDTAMDHQGRKCAGEAIAQAAMQDHVLREHAMQAMCRYLNVSSIPAWNDKAGRTAAEVIDTLYKVARLVDRQHAVS